MIVLDASVLIAYLDGHDVHHEAARQILEDEVDDEFGANSLTLAEVLVAPARQHKLADARAALRDLSVGEVPFPADTAVTLAQLRAETSLKMPDCFVLLAAEPVAARVATFDDRLRVAAERRGLQVLPLS